MTILYYLRAVDTLPSMGVRLSKTHMALPEQFSMLIRRRGREVEFLEPSSCFAKRSDY